MAGINIGPWGKDFHKLTERVYKEDLYVRTPKILDHAVKILLGGQLRQLMSEVDCENSDLKRAGSL